MLNFINSNKVLLGIILMFVIGGLSAITGVISPQAAVVINLIIGGLTTVGHGYNIIKGVKLGK